MVVDNVNFTIVIVYCCVAVCLVVNDDPTVLLFKVNIFAMIVIVWGGKICLTLMLFLCY